MDNEEEREKKRRKEREKKRLYRLKQTDEQKQKKRHEDNLRKKQARSQLTSEEAEAVREKNRIQQQVRRANLSMEEVEVIRERNRQSHRETRSNQSVEEVEARREIDSQRHREARSNQSVEEVEMMRESSRLRSEISRANITPDQLNRNRERSAFYRHLQQMNNASNGAAIEREDNISAVHNNDTPFDISSTINVDECIQSCQSSLNRTLLGHDEDGYDNSSQVHQILVCVICDQCIIGKEIYHWIDERTLKYHENILSHSYFYKEGINAILKSHYTVQDDQLIDLLLSPRSRRKRSENGTSYMCCRNCYEELSELKRRKRPPKYAISNGFAIGAIPQELTNNITPLVNNLVAPIRAFNYFIAFNGGREQKITGNFTFFAQDVSQNIGALQHMAVTNNNPSIFIVLLGSFTAGQLEKIRNKGSYNVDTFKRIYQFLHTNNDNYKLLPSIDNIPIPRVEMINTNENGEVEEEDGVDSNTEEQLCWKYWFPAVEDPNGFSATYQNQSEFAQALFSGYTPTMFYHPTKVISYAKLSQLCPIAFPFGTGDIDCKRSPAVSEIDCLQHYLKLSLPQFQEGQTVLIIHHFYQRRKSFLSGIAKCNISNNGNTIADQLANVTVDELEHAIKEMRNIPERGINSPQSTEENLSPHVKELIKCIKTSCAPIGYTNEAAAEARTKMFALWMTFGPPSLFFTFSPCDECSFKMQLFATASSVQLPSIGTPVEILSRDLSLRKSLRVKYPGACAREFDSLLQIIMSDLIGWEGLDFKKNGIFGKVIAHSDGIEEQGRTCLHGHLMLWVKGYILLVQQLFSEDENIRNNAKEMLEKYFDQVLSTSFDISRSEVNRCVHSGSDCEATDDNIVGASLQHLREMRHIGLLKKHHGKVIACEVCKKSWDTTEVVNSVIKDLFHLSMIEYPSFWSNDITFPFSYEQIELLAMRFQYDMINIPQEKEHTRRLLELLVMLFFNTHDWHHRKGCFKKSNECRFHIPHKPNSELFIQFHEENLHDMQSNAGSHMKSKWYHIDGTYHNVCSYDVVTRRRPWDVFVNTNNTTVSKVIGYNNNISMGSINTLYYCTLYTSKSNQEDETQPYVKALEAVSKRLKRVQESESEQNLSSRQVGLRHLLSGINSNLSSCVVSATMAWYLVMHGSRFHFSHEFKPLLLSQIEDWYKGKDFRRRIRYQKRKRNTTTGDDNVIPISIRSPTSNSVEEDQTHVWFESSILNYTYRPLNCSVHFDNVSMWEFESNYDLVALRAENFMGEDDEEDIDKKYFRFSHHHPGFKYSCLGKRSRECIPKLYYNSKFPDIEILQIEKGNDVEDHVKESREEYALKAMLLFSPFRNKEDIQGNYNTLWDSFMAKKQATVEDGRTHLQPPLYKYALQILQNIQDLINVKKVQGGNDILESCTDLYDVEGINTAHIGNEHEEQINIANDEDPMDNETQIQQLCQYVNILSQQTSTFNNDSDQQHRCKELAMSPSIINIAPSQIHSQLIEENSIDENNETNLQSDSNLRQIVPNHMDSEPVNRSIITVITRALDGDTEQFHTINYNVENNSVFDNITLTGIDMALCSIDHFIGQNNLDRKQAIAFQAICTSFMLSFLSDPSLDITQVDRQNFTTLLQQRGGKEQLLMCVTGPGGSGKSHVMKCCRMYCKLFCDSIGKPFNFSVFPVTATSNSAACLLQGMTIHSAAMINNKIVQMELSSDVDWTMTKVLIIDEISLADKNLFKVLDKNLRILTGNRGQLYGGIHIIFTGDFMQLKPVQGTPIYSSFDDILWHQSLNAAVFLDDRNHRFINDPLWGKILERVQIGLVTDEDLLIMNERLLSKVQLPDSIDCNRTRIAYGCYCNKKRNQITEASFLKFVSEDSPLYTSNTAPSKLSLIIKGIVHKQKRDVGADFHKLLWATCGDDNLTVSTTVKVDPCLKLIQGSSVMINQNIDKKRNIVKGAMGSYVGVRWKQGHTPHLEDYHGYKVNSAHVNDIECLVIKMKIDGKFVEIYPEEFSISIKFPGCNSKNLLKGYQIKQFPINLSLAITGHKLQGMTLDIMVLAEINLSSNWLYVLLSRVTTLKGLFLMMPLTKQMFKPISANLKRELEWLRDLEKQLLTQIGMEYTRTVAI